MATRVETLNGNRDGGLRGKEAVSCATHVAHGVLMQHVLLPACLPPASELCGSPPIVVGPNHSVCFRWNYADKIDAVSNGATVTDRCFYGLCGSFRRAGLPVHEVTPAALSAETLGMRIISSDGVVADIQTSVFSSHIGVARLDASSSCLRKGRATGC